MRLDATGLEEEVALEKARHLGHMEISESPKLTPHVVHDDAPQRLRGAADQA